MHVNNKCTSERMDMNASTEVQQLVSICSGNAESWPEALIEHLEGRQGQLSRTQVHAMHE